MTMSHDNAPSSDGRDDEKFDGNTKSVPRRIKKIQPFFRVLKKSLIVMEKSLTQTLY